MQSICPCKTVQELLDSRKVFLIGRKNTSMVQNQDPMLCCTGVAEDFALRQQAKVYLRLV